MASSSIAPRRSPPAGSSSTYGVTTPEIASPDEVSTADLAEHSDHVLADPCIMAENSIPETVVLSDGAILSDPVALSDTSRRNVQADTIALDSVETTSNPNVSNLAKDLVTLTKPRIVTMILVTTVATAFIGAGGGVPFGVMLILLLGTGMVAASAGAANQIWERRLDANMPRTANRPMPAGRVSIAPATVWAGVLLMAGAGVLFAQFGFVPAAVSVSTWLAYVIAYTPLKTRTSWNTTVGAIAGAMPVLIGYTATGGTLADPLGWCLFAVLGAWQYPHFMAIAWMYRQQYDDAGFRMSTTVEPTGTSAAWQAILGSIAVIIFGIATVLLITNSWFAWIAMAGVVLASFPMLRASLAFRQSRDQASARRLLRSSLLVLPIVLLVATLGVWW